MSIDVQYHRGISWDAWEELRENCTQAVERSAKGESFLLIGEPKPTYTYGKSGNRCDLRLPPSQTEGVDVKAVTRGGQWTYHGPGQIVVYPIMKLTDFGYASRGVRQYLNDIAKSLISWLQEYGVDAKVETPFGVYVDSRKLVSFGVRLQRGVVSHGFAIYWSTQEDPFKSIHPCGVPGQKTTSLVELGIDIDWESASGQIVETLKKSFLPRTKWAYNVEKTSRASNIGVCNG